MADVSDNSYMYVDRSDLLSTHINYTHTLTLPAEPFLSSFRSSWTQQRSIEKLKPNLLITKTTFSRARFQIFRNLSGEKNLSQVGMVECIVCDCGTEK